MIRRVSVVVLFPVIFISILFSAFSIRRQNTFIQDEYFHYDQIRRFIHGDKLFNEALMTYPGYHYILASIARVVRVEDVTSMYVIALITNILVIPLFFVTAKTVDKNTSHTKTLLFTFLPILFPFFPMIYTDVLSLFFILLSYVFAIKRKPVLSGIAAGMSVFIRQNNIIWLVFINTILYVRNNGWTIDRKKIVNHIKGSSTFLLGLIFLLFIIYSGHGLVVSSYAKSYVHLSFSLVNNVYFFLCLFVFLFIPVIVAQLSEIVSLVKRKPWVLIILLIFFPLFFLSFVNDHPFNQAPWFLHNLVMVSFTQSPGMKIFFYLIISISVLTLATIKFREKYEYLIYPFGVIYLLPYWLIDVRYSFIPFMFLILFNKKKNITVMGATLLYFLFWCLVFVSGISNRWFFL